MRAMVFDRYGEPDVMHLKDVPLPMQCSCRPRVTFAARVIRPESMPSAASLPTSHRTNPAVEAG
jgi:hypothetical protein